MRKRNAVIHVRIIIGITIIVINGIARSMVERLMIVSNRGGIRMNDLISRQAAIEAIGNDVMGGLNYQRILRELPSAQERIDAAYKEGYCDCEQEWLKERRQERKRGKWIRENIVLTSNPPQYQWHCSECGRMVHWFTAEVLTDFCPSCGADMRKDGDGE